MGAFSYFFLQLMNYILMRRYVIFYLNKSGNIS